MKKFLSSEVEKLGKMFAGEMAKMRQSVNETKSFLRDHLQETAAADASINLTVYETVEEVMNLRLKLAQRSSMVGHYFHHYTGLVTVQGFPYRGMEEIPPVGQVCPKVLSCPVPTPNPLPYSLVFMQLLVIFVPPQIVHYLLPKYLSPLCR